MRLDIVLGAEYGIRLVGCVRRAPCIWVVGHTGFMHIKKWVRAT